MKIYKFFLAGRRSEAIEYNSEEWDKELMDYDVVNNIFPGHLFCIRQKYIDGEMIYSSSFHIKKRAEYYEQGMVYINSYKWKLGKQQQEAGQGETIDY